MYDDKLILDSEWDELTIEEEEELLWSLYYEGMESEEYHLSHDLLDDIG